MKASTKNIRAMTYWLSLFELNSSEINRNRKPTVNC